MSQADACANSGGTENFSVLVGLNFVINTYWYGFVLIHHNNQQPFLKKLFQQPITNADKQKIIELVMTSIIDEIERNLEKINK